MANKLRENIQIDTTKSRLNDPVAGDLQAKYQVKGTTYVSNDPAIIPRDGNGNIVLNEGETDNPKLIIDPVAERITVRSALKVLDTRFQYYKFPTNVVAQNLNLNINIDIEQDPIFARYKPSENRTINAGTLFSGILMDELEDGQPQKNTNAYYISKAVKNSGVDLRFRIKINHRYDAPLPTSSKSTVAFTIMKQGPNYPLNRTYLGQYSRSGQDGRWSVMEPYEVWDTFIEVVIPNREFEIGDSFLIGALASVEGNSFFHTINSEQTYWSITDASKNVDEWNQPIE